MAGPSRLGQMEGGLHPGRGFVHQNDPRHQAGDRQEIRHAGVDSPRRSRNFLFDQIGIWSNGPITQLAEYLAFNQEVLGSIPSGPTK